MNSAPRNAKYPCDPDSKQKPSHLHRKSANRKKLLFHATNDGGENFKGTDYFGVYKFNREKKFHQKCCPQYRKYP